MAAATSEVPKMPWSVKPGEDYGRPVDKLIAMATLDGFTKEDFLKLAWAAVDQGSTYATKNAALEALEAINGMLPEEG